MSEFTVVFVDPKTREELKWIAALEPAGSLAVKAPDSDSRESLEELLSSANAIVTQRRAVDAAMIDSAPRLELIQRYGTRPDGIDLDAARKAGVQVATMPLRGCRHPSADTISSGWTWRGSWKCMGISLVSSGSAKSGLRRPGGPGLWEWRCCTTNGRSYRLTRRQPRVYAMPQRTRFSAKPTSSIFRRP